MKIQAIPRFAVPVYSLISRKTPFIKDVYKQVADEVSSRLSSGKILDVGTGPGHLPIAIARTSSALEITGIDLAPGMVKLANENAQGAGVSGRVKFIHANAASLPFEEGSFDLVISTLSLHHWADPAGCINEIHRVLKKGGEALIYDLRRDMPEGAKARARERYGRFLYFLLTRFVILHSSMSLKKAQELFSSHKAGFSKQDIQEKGILLCFHMVK